MPKCAHKDCDNTAEYTIKFHAYPCGHTKVQKNCVVGHFNIAVCESHKKASNVNNFFATHGWEKIQQELLSRGKALLDRSTLELIYERIQ